MGRKRAVSESEESTEEESEDSNVEESGSGSEESSEEKPSRKRPAAAKGKKSKAQEDSEDESDEEEASGSDEDSGDADSSDEGSGDEDSKPSAKKQKTAKAPPKASEARSTIANAARKRKLFEKLKSEMKAINAKAKAKREELQATEDEMTKLESVAGRMSRAVETLKKQKVAKSKKRANASWNNAKDRVTSLKQKLEDAKNKSKFGDSIKQKAQQKVANCEKHYKMLKKQDYHLSHEGFEAQRQLKAAQGELAKVKNNVDHAGSVADLEEKLGIAKEKFEALKEKRVAARDQGESKVTSGAKGKAKVMKKAKPGKRR